jgi:hypothetical protein
MDYLIYETKNKCSLCEEHGCEGNQPLVNIEHITKDSIYSNKKWACEVCLECDDGEEGSIGMAYFLIKNLQNHKIKN